MFENASKMASVLCFSAANFCFRKERNMMFWQLCYFLFAEHFSQHVICSPLHQEINKDCFYPFHLFWLPIVCMPLSLKQSLNILSRLFQLLELIWPGGRTGGLKIITSSAWSLTGLCISKFLLGEKHSIGNCCLAFCGNVNSTLLIGSKMFLML